MGRRLKQTIAKHHTLKEGKREVQLGHRQTPQQGPAPEKRGKGAKFNRGSGEWNAR